MSKVNQKEASDMGNCSSCLGSRESQQSMMEKANIKDDASLVKDDDKKKEKEGPSELIKE